MNYIRDELGVVVGRDGQIYAIGGYGWRQGQETENEARCLSSVEKRKDTGEWEEVHSMAVGRRAMAVVTLLDGVYAIGGFDGNNYLSSVERLDEKTGVWTNLQPMAQPRCTFAVVAT